jgi:FkbM family methyltransferase
METEESFVSYSQLQEDAALFRVLGNISRGFYIDVGAQDPNVDSVTKAFYERGWHGINIEPVRQWFDKLVQERPRDINLNLAIGSSKGSLKLFEVLDTGLSTANGEFAKRHKERGFDVQEFTVNLTTLNDVCAKEGVAEIHFLKIDVEGHEKEVLQGIDFSKIRPWIILIEATEPLSYVQTWKDWEDLLLNTGYTYVRTDGLNRFYLSKEHEELNDQLSQS